MEIATTTWQHGSLHVVEYGNLSPYLCMASLNTLMSCTDPRHLVTTKVNLMLKSQMANTLKALCLVLVISDNA
jgi:hypothetical protein